MTFGTNFYTIIVCNDSSCSSQNAFYYKNVTFGNLLTNDQSTLWHNKQPHLLFSGSKSKKGGAQRGAQTPTAPQAAQRSALSYRRPHEATQAYKAKAAVMSPNNLDAEVSLASTTSQSTYPKYRSQAVHTIPAHQYGGGGGGLDEPDQLKVHGSRFTAASEDSEDSDIDRRSLDLASSHTSDDDYENNHVFDPSDLKALSVNDFPQY